MKIPSPSVHIISVEIQRLRLVKMEHWTHKQIKYLVKKKDLYKTKKGFNIHFLTSAITFFLYIQN